MAPRKNNLRKARNATQIPKPTKTSKPKKPKMNVLYYQEGINMPGDSPDEWPDAASTHVQTSNADFVPYVVGDDDAYTMANPEAIEYVENKFQELKDCKEFQRTVLQAQTATNDRLASLESSVTDLLAANKLLAASNTSFQSRLSLLEGSSDVLLDIRSRFLSHVKRDNGFRDFNQTHDDQGAIDSGNRVAHNLDPVNDSRLYLEGKRQDEGTFEYLYGLPPPQRVHALRGVQI